MRAVCTLGWCNLFLSKGCRSHESEARNAYPRISVDDNNYNHRTKRAVGEIKYMNLYKIVLSIS